MKNKILAYFFTLSLCAISSIGYAQLTVSSSGDVTMTKKAAINGPAVSDTISLNVGIPSSGSRRYGVYSSFEEVIFPFPGSGCKIGILGQIHIPAGSPFQKSATEITTSYPFSAGVAGVASKNIGVYGSTASSLPTTWAGGNYAGYFNGTTQVVGTLYCTSLSQTSDIRTKNNILYLGDNALKKVMQLRPISFYYNQDEKLFNPEDTHNPAAKQMHYGFVAQELQEVIPDIVYLGQDSILSINYVELIPLLVQTVQNQEARIDDLERTIATLTSQASANKASRKINNDDISTQYVLYQNTPNPFSQDTRIAYELPLGTHDAKLYIYDANGIQLESYQISEFGSSSITISGGHLPAGMYLYSLIADEQVIDTKRMILTK